MIIHHTYEEKNKKKKKKEKKNWLGINPLLCFKIFEEKG